MQQVVGAGIDGTIVSITMGKTSIPCTKASYADSLDPIYLSYMGSQEQDEKSLGSYRTDATAITMTAKTFRVLFMPLFPANGAGNVQFPIVVLRSHPTLGSDSDLLVNNSITNFAAAVEASSKLEEVEIKLSTQQIKWTDRRVCLNLIAGTPQGVATI